MLASSRVSVTATPVGLIPTFAIVPSPTASSSLNHAHFVAHVTHTGGNAPWSIVVPTWIGAISTVGLLLGGIATTIFAIKAFRKQSKEVDLLEQQLADQQKFNQKQSKVLDLQADELAKSLSERLRAQAARVFIWQECLDDDHTTDYAYVA
jgi:negative regulator of sigma E activity